MMLVEATGRRDGRCRGCGRPIVWAVLASGQPHPFDPPLKIVAEQDSLFDDRILQVVDTRISPSHFTTCRAREHFTKARPAVGRRGR